MKNLSARIVLGIFLIIMGTHSGCASGGFKLTRSYSQWVNSQNLILRIILYILTSVVYGITLIADLVIFNTLDFWNGRVSQGDFQFQENGKKYLVKHRLNNGRRHSTIEVHEANRVSTIHLAEVESGDIIVYENNQKKAEFIHLKSWPVVRWFTTDGITDERPLFTQMDFLKTNQMAQLKK